MSDGCVNCIFFLQISGLLISRKKICTKYNKELDEERIKLGCCSFSLELKDKDADQITKDFEKDALKDIENIRKK